MHLIYDEFSDAMLVGNDDTPVGLDGWRAFTDMDKVALRCILETGADREVSERDVRDFLLTTRSMHTIDRGKAWLQPLQWDGNPRIGDFLHSYCGAPANDYTRACSRYLWTALAGRVLEPGCKADMMIVLVSPQGWGKTRAVNALVPRPEFAAEISLHEKSDDLARKIRGRMVCELAELDGVSKRDVEWLKSFISRTHETWVPKYQEFTSTFGRRCIFIGTSNRDDFLIDDTGNRRWLPIRLEHRDIIYSSDARIVTDREQLWAEGAAMFQNFGVVFREAEELAKQQHAEFLYDDSWADTIASWLVAAPVGLDGKPAGLAPVDRPHVKMVEILQGALRLDIAHRNTTAEKRAGAALRALGWASATMRLEGNVQRVWRKHAV